jgi:hypothetical protein
LEKAGIIEVAEKAGAEVKVFGKDGWQVLFDRSGWRQVKVSGGQYLRITINMLKAWNYVTKMCHKSVTKLGLYTKTIKITCIQKKSLIIPFVYMLLNLNTTHG